MALMAPQLVNRPPPPPRAGYNAPADLIQRTAALARQKGYSVEPDGRVYTMQGGSKSYLPPWVVWQGEEARLPDGSINPAVLPGSDPNSPWHAMFSAGGPFTNKSTWDPEKGTYEGSIDWPQLLTTIGVGGLLGVGVAAAVGAGAGGGGVAASGVGLGETGATTGLASGVGLPGATAATAAGTSAAGATAAGAYGPMAGGYAGATTSAAAPASIAAGSSAPAWMNSALWRTGVNAGLNTLGTYMDNRGRQQAAETLAAAAKDAQQYSQQQTAQSAAMVQAAQQRTAPMLQYPGYYQQGQTMPSSFAQLMGPAGTSGAPRINVPTPQGRMTLDGTTSGPSQSAPSAAPSDLSPVRQWIREQFLSPQNKNPQREPTERDYQYWEALATRPDMDPAYLQQRMFDREGEGSNAGHFQGQGGPTNFAQMMPPQGGSPYAAQITPQQVAPFMTPPPQMQAYQGPTLAQLMTVQRPQYQAPPPMPWTPYQMGPRM